MTFLANARTMLGGFAVAQAIPIAVSPLLTRLFTPEAFGLQALFMSLTAALIVVATLRLDLALLMAEGEEGRDIVGLMTALLLGVAAVLAIAIFLFGGQIAEALGHAGRTLWLWLLVPMTAAGAFIQMSTGLLSRDKRFRPVARTGMINQATYASVAATLAAAAGTQGLVIAKFSGQALGALFITSRVRLDLLRPRLPDGERLAHLWRRFHQFVLFNTPYSLIGTVSRETPIYVFAAFAATAAAGYYGLARMLLNVPALLATAALSQVFFREAIEFKGTPKLEATTVALLRITMLASAPLFAFICVWGDVVFGLVFGSEWNEAGTYAMILAPASWLALQTGWPERLFEVAMRQDVSFKVQMGFDLLSAAAVVSPMMLGADPIVSVAAFAAVNCLYQLGYLVAMFSVSGFSRAGLRHIVLRGIALMGAGCFVFAMIRLAPVQPAALALLCGLCASAAAALLTLAHIRNVVGLTAIAEGPQ